MNKDIFNLPNFLSFLRIPLAFLLLVNDSAFRFFVIGVTALTDGLDGYLARKWNQKSKIGTLLDPIADKFFAFFLLIIFLAEQKINFNETLILLSRDIAVLLFGFFLLILGKLNHYKYHSIISGKITTTLQFFVFAALNFNFSIPSYVYTLFIFLGFTSFLELLITLRKYLKTV